jgi:protein-S-isoprenylcysteine O-methyltransferase Ste14
MKNADLGQFFFRYRNAVGPGVFLVALLIGTPSYPLGRDDLNLLLDGIGVFVALLGQALRILTIGYEYIERGGRDRKVYASTLVQGGVFAHCRNPLYLGNIMLAVGIALVVHSAAFYLIVLPVVGFAYLSIVAAEEAFLLEKFGDEYRRYCRHVNRWIPEWRGWTQSIAGMHFNWRRVVVKEYNTAFVLVFALTLVKLWSDYRVRGSAAIPSGFVLLCALAIWLGAYFFVRALKKTGYVKA